MDISKTIDEINTITKGTKSIVLLEPYSLLNTFYASNVLHYYKTLGYVTTLVINEKYKPLHKASPHIDHVLGIRIPPEFNYECRRKLLEYDQNILAPNPVFARSWPELILTQPLIIQQYYINSRIPIDYQRECISIYSLYEIDHVNTFIAANIFNIDRLIVLENIPGDLQEYVYILRSKNIDVLNVTGQALKATIDGNSLSLKDLRYLLECVKNVIGKTGDVISLACSCHNIPNLFQVDILPQESFKTIFNISNCYECSDIKSFNL